MSNLETYRLLSKLKPPAKLCNVEGTECAVSIYVLSEYSETGIHYRSYPKMSVSLISPVYFLLKSSHIFLISPWKCMLWVLARSA